MFRVVLVVVALLCEPAVCRNLPAHKPIFDDSASDIGVQPFLVGKHKSHWIRTRAHPNHSLETEDFAVRPETLQAIETEALFSVEQDQLKIQIAPDRVPEDELVENLVRACMLATLSKYTHGSTDVSSIVAAHGGDLSELFESKSVETDASSDTVDRNVKVLTFFLDREALEHLVVATDRIWNQNGKAMLRDIHRNLFVFKSLERPLNHRDSIITRITAKALSYCFPAPRSATQCIDVSLAQVFAFNTPQSRWLFTSVLQAKFGQQQIGLPILDLFENNPKYKDEFLLPQESDLASIPSQDWALMLTRTALAIRKLQDDTARKQLAKAQRGDLVKANTPQPLGISQDDRLTFLFETFNPRATATLLVRDTPTEVAPGAMIQNTKGENLFIINTVGGYVVFENLQDRVIYAQSYAGLGDDTAVVQSVDAKGRISLGVALLEVGLKVLNTLYNPVITVPTSEDILTGVAQLHEHWGAAEDAYQTLQTASSWIEQEFPGLQRTVLVVTLGSLDRDVFAKYFSKATLAAMEHVDFSFLANFEAWFVALARVLKATLYAQPISEVTTGGRAVLHFVGVAFSVLTAAMKTAVQSLDLNIDWNTVSQCASGTSDCGPLGVTELRNHLASVTTAMRGAVAEVKSRAGVIDNDLSNLNSDEIQAKLANGLSGYGDACDDIGSVDETRVCFAVTLVRLRRLSVELQAVGDACKSVDVVLCHMNARDDKARFECPSA